MFSFDLQFPRGIHGLSHWEAKASLLRKCACRVWTSGVRQRLVTQVQVGKCCFWQSEGKRSIGAAVPAESSVLSLPLPCSQQELPSAQQLPCSLCPMQLLFLSWMHFPEMMVPNIQCLLSACWSCAAVIRAAAGAATRLKIECRADTHGGLFPHTGPNPPPHPCGKHHYLPLYLTHNYCAIILVSQWQSGNKTQHTAAFTLTGLRGDASWWTGAHTVHCTKAPRSAPAGRFKQSRVLRGARMRQWDALGHHVTRPLVGNGTASYYPNTNAGSRTAI